MSMRSERQNKAGPATGRPFCFQLEPIYILSSRKSALDSLVDRVFDEKPVTVRAIARTPENALRPFGGSALAGSNSGDLFYLGRRPAQFRAKDRVYGDSVVRFNETSADRPVVLRKAFEIKGTRH
jgi:hypothetical protein